MWAKMIASHDHGQIHLSRRGRWLVAAMACALWGACASDRETTLMRSRRAREAGALRAEREQQEREIALWAATNDQARRAAAEARRGAVEASSRLRSARLELQLELGKLQQREQSLDAARRRAQEIERQLGPLRALEAQLRSQDAQLVAVEERIKQLAGEVAKATESAAQQEAQLKPRLKALQNKLQQLQAAGASIVQAEALVAAASKVLATPPTTKKPPGKKD